jgi:small-conductance mechanosensitive channel
MAAVAEPVATELGKITPAITPSSSPVSTPAATGHDKILSFLGTVIDWYQHLAIEAQLVTEPADSLFLAEDRQIAEQVVKLAFDYARASAAMLVAERGKKGTTVMPSPERAAAETNPQLGSEALTSKLAEVQSTIAAINAKIAAIRKQLLVSGPRQRARLNAQLVAAQGELDLAQSRADALNAMIDFEQKTVGGHGNALIEQIEELRRSLATTSAVQNKIQAAGQSRAMLGSGILDLGQRLLELQRKSQELQSSISLTRHFGATIDAMRAPLIDELHQIERDGATLAAKGAVGDLAAVQQRKKTFEYLVYQHKLIVGALLPLAQINVLLQSYENNLNRWDQAVDRRIGQTFRTLVVRLIVLASLIGMIIIGAIAWRRLTFRYVHDALQRHRLLQVRTLTVIVLLVIVILFNFSTEIGALATVMGLATAGIAFALQNVILSVAGYFFLNGRYGVRVGDRVELVGVYGTVIDIGLVKLTLMELSGEGNLRQPTGRMAVFANSIVFQFNGNLLKQAPGFNFSWNELTLTLAPECDVALAEKLVSDAVNDVCARFRENLRREYHETARQLNVWFEPPEPKSRLVLSSSGVTLTVRYPVETRRAMDINDEISRRVLNVINHEPRLRLVSTVAPAIQPVELHSDDSADNGQAVPTSGVSRDSE